MSRDLLNVEAGVSLVAAVQQMAERNVGAVLVMEAGRLAGIMTERDLMPPLRVACATTWSSANA